MLVNGILADDSLDLAEEALLSHANSNRGSFVIDLGRVQPVAAVATYSWREWAVDQGSRAPQVYALHGGAAESPELNNPGGWTKISEMARAPQPFPNPPCPAVPASVSVAKSPPRIHSLCQASV